MKPSCEFAKVLQEYITASDANQDNERIRGYQ